MQANEQASEQVADRLKACSYAAVSELERNFCSVDLARLCRFLRVGQTPRLHSAMLSDRSSIAAQTERQKNTKGLSSSVTRAHNLIEYRQGKHFSTQATSRTESFKLVVCSEFRLKVIA